MSNSVLVLDSATILKMKSHYTSDLTEKVPPGGIFSAKLPGCSITAYKSGKVLFQGPGAEAAAAQWGGGAPREKTISAKSPSSVKTHSYSPPKNVAELSLIGSDEVGTGDFFGPMTVVAVYANKDHLPLLKELGVKDSKNLKDSQIMEIGSLIKEVVPFSLLVLDNEKYNRMQAKGMSQGKMKALLHNQAIKKLLQKISPEEPDGILIDQFAQPGVFFNYLKGSEVFKSKNTYLSTKAEGLHLSVAAASILARYAFVKHFELLSEKAGFTLPKGAGPVVDNAGARLLHEKGEAAMSQFTKVHFANTEKAKAIYKKKYKS
ncbi:ribonuclease HIII [Peribacillus deserti]|uniref:Ribonuclease HIII n=1 Tax=Peribacillus deserti TaxID=673318 RepID=A0ABS2QI78_9BACI|nr:ribonuclease HIII [Peribacillus deserti]MBM7692006.1 ribonuclease HIII [Peribacillus deserti]